MIYVSIIKRVLDRDYGKERVFYSDGEWYDRYTCRHLSLDELEKEMLDISAQSEEDHLLINEMTDKIYELMDEEEADNFFDSIHK